MWTRETILAAFGVPPGRVGLPTANYAIQRQQDLVYWTNLMGRARLIEPALSMLLARSGQAGVVRFDFGGVPVLQEQAAQATRAQLGELIANLNQYTAFQVRGILEVALSNGWSVGEIQGALVKNAAFGPARPSQADTPLSSLSAWVRVARW